MNKQAIALPSLKKDTKLPVILNESELKELFSAPTLLKHRIVLAFTYAAGLRGQEVINMKISNIDFERKTIHIRQSKYKKDRIVPLSGYMSQGLVYLIKRKKPGKCIESSLDVVQPGTIAGSYRPLMFLLY